MLSPRRTRLAFIIVGTVALLVGPLGTAPSFADTKELVGTWSATITGGPGTPPLPTWYGALVTFDRDGGLVATITDPLITTGHGAWLKTGHRTFVVTILLRQFDAAGNFLGTLRARATIVVNREGDQFTGDPYSFEFFDENGNPTSFAGVGTAHGTRIVVEP